MEYVSSPDLGSSAEAGVAGTGASPDFGAAAGVGGTNPAGAAFALGGSGGAEAAPIPLAPVISAAAIQTFPVLSRNTSSGAASLHTARTHPPEVLHLPA